MRIVDIHEAKANLSKLVEEASKGDGFIIAKEGKPLVTVLPLAADHRPKSRVGFLKGVASVPADFDEMGREEISRAFEDSR